LKYKLQLLVVGEYTRINLFYHSLNLQKRIHRPMLFNCYVVSVISKHINKTGRTKYSS